MSIRNQRTGRHEDDLYDELLRSANGSADGKGYVPLRHLIEHLNETIVEVSDFGSNVCAPVKMATLLLENLIAQGILSPDDLVGL